MCLPPWVARAFADQDRTRMAARRAELAAIRHTTTDPVNRTEETSRNDPNNRQQIRVHA